MVKQIFRVDKWRFKIMNICFKYNLKIQINLIFALTSLYNFIKDYFPLNIYYFEAENDDSIILFSRSDNLPLSNFLVILPQINKKRNTIADAIWVDYTSYLIQRDFII